MDEKNGGFEVKMSRLEEIVKKMESGEAALDEMLALFEEGVGLVKSCSEILTRAEQRVVLLTKEKDGEWNESDFRAAE